MTRIEEIARDQRKELADLEVAYLKAKEYIKTEEYVRQQTAALRRIWTLFFGVFEFTDAKAHQTLGRIQQILLDTYQSDDVIVQYESIKKSLAKMFPEEK